MPVDRDAVLDAAKYLRGVRPLDPAELREYVEGQPRDAVVRQVLREHAPDLGVVERGDGTFTPAPEDPVRPSFSDVTALPDRYDRAVEDLLVAEYGAEWYRDESGDRLRETIRRFKDDYYRRNPVEYDREVALGYAIYHLAGYYAAVQYVLATLAEDGLLPGELRVLDLGAGVGGPALGLFDFLPEDALVDYHAVEPSAAADVLDDLLDEAPRNVHPTIHRETAEAFEPDGEYDLVLACSVLSELGDPEAVVRTYLGSLADDGTFLALAPADKHTSTHLRAVERAVEDDPATVYGPTPRLWPGRRPTDRGWTFDERPTLDAPTVQARLADASQDPGEFRHTDVRYSYSLLRVDDRRQHEVELSGDRLLALGDADDRVTDRADVVAAKLSRNLAAAGDDDDDHDGDANPVFKVSDGSEDTDCYAVLVRPTSLNRDVEAADYGDLVSVEDALVLWNDDEGAYNLVLDEETVVDRA